MSILTLQNLCFKANKGITPDIYWERFNSKNSLPKIIQKVAIEIFTKFNFLEQITVFNSSSYDKDIEDRMFSLYIKPSEICRNIFLKNFKNKTKNSIKMLILLFINNSFSLFENNEKKEILSLIKSFDKNYCKYTTTTYTFHSGFIAGSHTAYLTKDHFLFSPEINDFLNEIDLNENENLCNFKKHFKKCFQNHNEMTKKLVKAPLKFSVLSNISLSMIMTYIYFRNDKNIPNNLKALLYFMISTYFITAFLLGINHRKKVLAKKDLVNFNKMFKDELNKNNHVRIEITERTPLLT